MFSHLFSVFMKHKIKKSTSLSQDWMRETVFKRPSLMTSNVPKFDLVAHIRIEL